MAILLILILPRHFLVFFPMSFFRELKFSLQRFLSSWLSLFQNILLSLMLLSIGMNPVLFLSVCCWSTEMLLMFISWFYILQPHWIIISTDSGVESSGYSVYNKIMSSWGGGRWMWELSPALWVVLLLGKWSWLVSKSKPSKSWKASQ